MASLFLVSRLSDSKVIDQKTLAVWYKAADMLPDPAGGSVGLENVDVAVVIHDPRQAKDGSRYGGGQTCCIWAGVMISRR